MFFCRLSVLLILCLFVGLFQESKWPCCFQPWVSWEQPLNKVRRRHALLCKSPTVKPAVLEKMEPGTGPVSRMVVVWSQRFPLLLVLCSSTELERNCLKALGQQDCQQRFLLCMTPNLPLAVANSRISNSLHQSLLVCSVFF